MALADADIITRARHELQDVVSGAYRWTDSELTLWIKDGAREIARIRPEAVVGYQTTPIAVTLPSNSTTILEMYTSSLVDYVCYRAFSKDGEDGESGAAGRYYQTFLGGLGVRRPN